MKNEIIKIAKPLLVPAFLEYVKKERIRLYNTRMMDYVDYDSVMLKVDAFEIVENHLKKQLKNDR